MAGARDGPFISIRHSADINVWNYTFAVPYVLILIKYR